MRAAKREPAARNAVIVRYKLDVMVAAPSLKEAEEAIQIRSDARLLAWESIVVRSANGYISPAWRVTDDGTTLTVEPKRKRKTA